MKQVWTVLLAVVAFAWAQNSLSPDLSKKLDEFVIERMTTGKIPGLSLVIVQGGKVVYAKGYGYANLEAKTPMTERTLVPIGSTGKAMTALAVMQLVEQGKLELDASVVRYLPWFKVDDLKSGEITLRQLLTHTSGLPAGGVFDGKQEAGALEARVRSLASVKLNRAPGSGFEYANDGYAVVGLVVQTVSGMAYEDYMAQKVFAPLGMSSTTFDIAAASRTGMVQGYTLRRGAVRAAPTPFSRAIAPAGTMLSSASDVGHYFEALLNGNSTLSQQSLDEMWKPAVPFDELGAIALGWGVFNLPSGPVLTHEGSIFTAGSFFVLDVRQKFGLAVLVNLQNRTMSEVGQGVFGILAGETPPPPQRVTVPAPSSFKPDKAIWQNYVGDYATAREPLRVYIEGEQLVLSIARPSYPVRYELEPLSNTEFLLVNTASDSSNDLAPASFMVEEGGRVTLLIGGRPAGIKR